ncbi:MAG: hypothetical protein KTR14_02300 [Vampirovibrio sp.]|nr:hypothetical protein [Vampirovibrio sp.]
MDQYEQPTNLIRKSEPVKPSRLDDPDPLVYATFLSTSLQERNVLVLAVQSVQQWVKVLIGLPAKMKAIKVRLAQLEARQDALTKTVDAGRYTTVGQKINMLR